MTLKFYIDRKKRWDKLFAYGKSVVVRGSLTEADISVEIQAHRQQKVTKR